MLLQHTIYINYQVHRMNHKKIHFYWWIPILLLVISCFNSKQQSQFRAASDGFLGDYSLDLYKNDTYYLVLPALRQRGKFHVKQDTIYLLAEEDTTITYKFLIDKKKNQIRTVNTKNGNWMSIYKNELRERK